MALTACIQASNLRVGGGMGGAASFIDELPWLAAEGHLDWARTWHVRVSSGVLANMVRAEEVSRLDMVEWEVTDDEPGLTSLLRAPTRTYDVRFTVRGPDYWRRTARYELLGFADATVVFPWPKEERANLKAAATLLAKNIIKRALLHRYDGYVVQTERMANRLRQLNGTADVTVLPNSPSELFSTRGGQARSRDFGAEGITLVYPARGYPHKNHAFLPSVAREFTRRTGVRLRFKVTLTDTEMSALGLHDEPSVVNVGPQDLQGCAELYAEADGLFFASLNETFSVTPLEAMASGRPALCSDLDFIRAVSGPVPMYFDARDPESGATAVAGAFLDAQYDADRVAAGVDFVAGLPSPRDRAVGYIAAMRKGVE